MKHSSAFTFIEVLITVAIISTLIAIAIPRFFELQATSNDTSAWADAKNSINILAASKAR
ncbi:type IV pilin protein [Pseudomonas phenolilytica]|uniref:type IV pilin protein n=1 Tax=Pseudomonas phenolilytica TaxID=2746321 RepID=UPI0009BF69CC|nr:prepilin-type N-terminal cleavage/methylation domain-containing protein [Pseudomonas phenolilytica]UIP86727.1 prepilin-type N-terminal cleavage/methylation domain-containing protein [Pseudomonas phenolilytica]